MASLRDFGNLDIDWSMTPEDAVTTYLEWGNNPWQGGRRQPVRSKTDQSVYFVVYNWDDAPRAILIRRNSDEARELFSLELPPELAKGFREEVGGLKGVYAPTPEVRRWLQRELEN
ncbi:MAG: hypothetical protein PHV85_06200 [Desulfovibrionaceae bacterium]|nr:hypothetical protein [Desulfovibrionaceae bacterium]